MSEGRKKTVIFYIWIMRKQTKTHMLYFQLKTNEFFSHAKVFIILLG